MWLVVVRSCWVKAYKLMTRYLFNMISGFVTFYIVFALLFFGTKSIGGGVIDLGDTLEGIFAGYLTWMLAMMGSTELAWNVTSEAQTGTFEQQYLSPVGYRWIALFTESFNFVYNISLIFLIALVMAVTTGQKIHLHLGSTLPVMLSVYVQATGLGLALAGLALMYKRIQSFFQVVQFLMIGFLLVPWDRFPWARYLLFAGEPEAPPTHHHERRQDMAVAGLRPYPRPLRDGVVRCTGRRRVRSGRVQGTGAGGPRAVLEKGIHARQASTRRSAAVRACAA